MFVCTQTSVGWNVSNINLLSIVSNHASNLAFPWRWVRKTCTIAHKSQLQTCKKLMPHARVNIFSHQWFPRHRDKTRWVCTGLRFSVRSGLNCGKRQLEHIADISTSVSQSRVGRWRCCPPWLSDLLLFALTYVGVNLGNLGAPLEARRLMYRFVFWSSNVYILSKTGLLVFSAIRTLMCFTEKLHC